LTESGDLDVVVRDVAALVTMDAGDGEAGVRHDVAIGVTGGRVQWIGPAARAPAARVVRSARGAVVVPGLVDCHTHAVWAGSRADEWRRRIEGESYTSILEGGGGIASTVEATRAAPDRVLRNLAIARLRALRRRGVTRVEIKSGYGLTPMHEARLLRVAREAATRAGMPVRTTFLGAHALPRELRSNRAAYVAQIVAEQIPAVAGLADFADAYVDLGAFTVDEGHTVLAAAKAAGMRLRVHAEQVARTGAAEMAASLGAASADHLERIDDRGIAALARAGTTAVLLPGAMTWLRDERPPVDALREAGVPIAVATDLNPGSSPFFDPWTVLALAANGMRLRPDQALAGMTRVAADLLGWPEAGRIRVGGPAEMVCVAPPPGERPTVAGILGNVGGSRVRWVMGATGPLP
jgi:imidazolonepropionase